MDLHDAFAPLDNEAGAAGADADPWRPVLPVPEGSPERADPFVARFAPAGFTLSTLWLYPDAGGRLLGAVARYDRPANGHPTEKQVKPFTFCEGPGGRQEWRCKGLAEPRPLYGLDRLAANPTADVLVVEGEKAADAAQRRFPHLVVVTSPGGSKAARRADWSPLAGRRATIWPDADDPGTRYADDVADMARRAGAVSVRIVKLPAGLPQGWDLADVTAASRADVPARRHVAHRRMQLSLASERTWRSNRAAQSPVLRYTTQRSQRRRRSLERGASHQGAPRRPRAATPCGPPHPRR